MRLAAALILSLFSVQALAGGLTAVSTENLSCAGRDEKGRDVKVEIASSPGGLTINVSGHVDKVVLDLSPLALSARDPLNMRNSAENSHDLVLFGQDLSDLREDRRVKRVRLSGRLSVFKQPAARGPVGRPSTYELRCIGDLDTRTESDKAKDELRAARPVRSDDR